MMTKVENVLVKLAQTMMESLPRYGDPDDLHLLEIFESPNYKFSDEKKKLEIQYLTADFAYQYEMEIPFFEQYFPRFDVQRLRGSSLLDLGSFTGGRLARWVELYGVKRGFGIDVKPIFAEAGSYYAERKKLPLEFVCGVGEELPYEDNSMDFIVSFDVFEHVQDLQKVLLECLRVLKPDGSLLAVFPPYFNPLESHLRLATRMHGLHLIFPGVVLTRAYYNVLKKRDGEADWYARDNPNREYWERSPFLNGTTVSRFRKMLNQVSGFEKEYDGVNSFLSFGRTAQKPHFRFLAKTLKLPAYLPILEEFFLGRICVQLRKKESL